MLAARTVVSANANWADLAPGFWDKLDRDFPIPSDWMLQDLGERRNDWFGPEGNRQLERDLFAGVLEELGDYAIDGLRQDALKLLAEDPGRNDPRWLRVYIRLCEQRRALRLKTVLARAPKIIFAKHFNMGGSHYAYTEGLSDANNERCFFPGTALCLLEMNGLYGRVTNLLADARGVIRDPNISWDGQRVVFAWKKSDRLDDYHLYELDMTTRSVRQITFGLGYADYEPAYLPDGDIIFNSTRCVQPVDCWWTEVSNLYACDPQGRFLRRLVFDQVHANYPQVLDDGRVTYTRWEYNDRGQIFVQCLFQMNPDGTAQSEYYGGNSWFPTTLLHARGIPGTGKVAAIATGHHTSQAGKLVLVDPDKGRQENQGVQLIAPVRETKAARIDAYGQEGPLWMYPCPLNENEFLVTYAALGKSNPDDRHGGWFSIFYMDKDGRRELLASDPERSCCQPVPLTPRQVPQLRATIVDYGKDCGTYYLQDVYAGPGLAGIPRGAAKTLRVVALAWRAAAVGANGNGGVAGGALVCTPPSISNGSWDVKRVLGIVPIEANGSALFTVPARTPVYFQVLDANNHVIQTMRSWSTLQPGEYFSCVGCHEHKNAAPPEELKSARKVLADGHPARLNDSGTIHVLDNAAPGFSYLKQIQPLLDRECVRCHDGRRVWTQTGRVVQPNATGNFPPDLSATPTPDPGAKRVWTASYVALTGGKKQFNDESALREYRAAPNRLVNWVHPQSAPPVQPPYSAGSCKSELLVMLEKGHGNAHLTRAEIDRIACWIDLAVPFCGDYVEANTWSDAERRRHDYFQQKQNDMKAMEAEGIRAYATRHGGASVSYRDGGSLPPRSGGETPLEIGGASTVPVRKDPALNPQPSTLNLSIGLLDSSGSVIASETGEASADKPLKWELAHEWAAGERIILGGAEYLAIQLDPALPESIIYTPQGRFEFAVPVAANLKRAYPPKAFSGKLQRMSVRPVTAMELGAYRNLALNPCAQTDVTNTFPHATSNSECRNDPVFAARNAIDGFKSNTKHGGWPWQSWGPEQTNNPWLQVDFGREVQIDRVMITLRADFPHDKVWKKGRLQFSNGSSETITLAATAEPQEFFFRRPILARWLRLDDLAQELPLGWCALSEIEVYGRDALPITKTSL